MPRPILPKLIISIEERDESDTPSSADFYLSPEAHNPYTLFETQPLPSPPPSPTQVDFIRTPTPRCLQARPFMPMSGVSPNRRAREEAQEDCDVEDELLLTLLAEGSRKCEACSAVFASTRQHAFLSHVKLNKCRRRQLLAGRTRLGRWWVQQN